MLGSSHIHNHRVVIVLTVKHDPHHHLLQVVDATDRTRSHAPCSKPATASPPDRDDGNDDNNSIKVK